LAPTLIEGSIDLDLNVLALEAVSPFNQANANSVALDLYDFILDRTRGYYLEQGIRADVFEAVAALKPDSLFDFDQRLRALVEFAQLPQAQNLAAANKRISNILRQAREKNIPIAASVDTSLLEDGAEAALANALQAISIDAKSSYVDALKQLAKLQAPVDAFFDNVMVMVEDHAVRANRLSLLNELRDRFLAIADISVMQAG
jgi:glycyl-tRNA synthetase beta chain